MADKIASILNNEMELQIESSEHPYEEEVIVLDDSINDPAVYNRYSIEYKESFYNRKLIIKDILENTEDKALEKAVTGRLNYFNQLADERDEEIRDEIEDKRDMIRQYEEMDKMFA